MKRIRDGMLRTADRIHLPKKGGIYVCAYPIYIFFLNEGDNPKANRLPVK